MISIFTNFNGRIHAMGAWILGDPPYVSMGWKVFTRLSELLQ